MQKVTASEDGLLPLREVGRPDCSSLRRFDVKLWIWSTASSQVLASEPE